MVLGKTLIVLTVLQYSLCLSSLSLPSQFSVVYELMYESQIGVQTNSSKLYDQIYISSGIKVCMNAIKFMGIEHRRYTH